MFDDCDSRKIKCFLCAHIFKSDEESWMIFDGSLERSLSSILSSALSLEIDEQATHSILLCSECKTLILEYGSLEQRFNAIRNEILSVYYGTAKPNNRAPILIDGDLDLDGITKEKSPIDGGCIENDVAIAFENPLNTINDEFVLKTEVFIIEEIEEYTDETNNYAAEALPLDIKDTGFNMYNTAKSTDNEIDSSAEIVNINEEDSNGTKHSSHKNLRNSESNSEIIACDVCDKKFINQKTYDTHMKYHHSRTKVTELNKPDECEKCGKRFKSKNELQYHINSFHEAFVCVICNEEFLIKSDYVKHLNKHADAWISKIESSKKDLASSSCNEKKNTAEGIESFATDIYKCTECDALLCTANSLKMHTMTHAHAPFKCIVCSKRFFKKSNMLLHAARHSKFRFKCDLCNKKYMNNWHLKIHKMTHTNYLEGRVKCNICNKLFDNNSMLETHKKTHKKKRFECDICCKKFISRKWLKNHKMTHNKDKIAHSFECDICKKKYSRKINLSIHKKTHSEPILPKFKCNICKEQFKKSWNLQIHKLTHKP